MKSRVLQKGTDYRKLKGYKYQTLLSQYFTTLFRPAEPLITELGWVALEPGGQLIVRTGYCWDGASGPTFDTASTMRASLAHDALYQMMREELLDAKEDRDIADYLLMELMVADGAWFWRARLWLWAVRTFAGRSAR